MLANRLGRVASVARRIASVAQCVDGRTRPAAAISTGSDKVPLNFEVALMP